MNDEGVWEEEELETEFSEDIAHFTDGFVVVMQGWDPTCRVTQVT